MRGVGKIRLGFFLIITMVAARLMAAPATYISLSPQSLSTVYDADADTTQTVYMTLSLPTSYSSLNYCVTFTPYHSSEPYLSNSTIKYQIYDSASSPRTNLLDSYLSGTMARPGPNEAPSITTTFVVVIEHGSLILADTYSGKVTLSLYEGTSPSKRALYSTQLNIAATVNEIMNVVVVPEGQPYDYAITSPSIDFGYLQEGRSRSIDLVWRVNTKSYAVTLSSSNGGYLSYADTSAQITDTIPYSLSIDGSMAAFDNKNSVNIKATKKNNSYLEDRSTLQFTIGALDFPYEGLYSDTLTVSIAKN